MVEREVIQLDSLLLLCRKWNEPDWRPGSFHYKNGEGLLFSLSDFVWRWIISLYWFGTLPFLGVIHA